jgi:hypothetical protein
LNHFILKNILCLFCVISFTKAISQNLSTGADSPTLIIKKEAAIRAANLYMKASLSNKQLALQFLADSTSSLIICDDYKTLFSSTTVYCSPVGYEIGLLVLLESRYGWDTLHTNMYLPLDSSLAVVSSSFAGLWHEGYLNAWEKVISNQFKVGYSDVLRFIRNKRQQQYNIDFGYENLNYRQGGKPYWFVAAGSLLYRIDPITGKIKVRKLLPVKVRKDVY